MDILNPLPVALPKRGMGLVFWVTVVGDSLNEMMTQLSCVVQEKNIPTNCIPSYFVSLFPFVMLFSEQIECVFNLYNCLWKTNVLVSSSFT